MSPHQRKPPADYPETAGAATLTGYGCQHGGRCEEACVHVLWRASDDEDSPHCATGNTSTPSSYTRRHREGGRLVRPITRIPGASSGLPSRSAEPASEARVRPVQSRLDGCDRERRSRGCHCAGDGGTARARRGCSISARGLGHRCSDAEDDTRPRGAGVRSRRRPGHSRNFAAPTWVRRLADRR